MGYLKLWSLRLPDRRAALCAALLFVFKTEQVRLIYLIQEERILIYVNTTVTYDIC